MFNNKNNNIINLKFMYKLELRKKYTPYINNSDILYNEIVSVRKIKWGRTSSRATVSLFIIFITLQGVVKFIIKIFMKAEEFI